MIKGSSYVGLTVGIVTILKTNNYGAELQAFALCHKLNLMGLDAEIIDFLFYKNPNFRRTKKSKSFVNIGLKRRLKEWLIPIIESVKSLHFNEAKRKRNLRYERFHEYHTKISQKTYHSIDELYNAALDYDIYIVGSDQVWNPYSNINLEPYFLTFAPKNKKKISYASSFGVSKIPLDATSSYKECLNNLNHISVREEQGVEIIRDLIGRKACHVLDPTLLLDFNGWVSVATFPIEKKNYLLLYVLTNSDYATQLAKKVAEDLNLTLVRICKNAMQQDSDKSIINIIDAGPSEFVGLFMNASFVITNSFHGTTFSVNFKKSFYTVLPEHKENNSRQESFLSMLGLSERLIKENSPPPEAVHHKIDFIAPSGRLDEARKSSIEYLVNVLEESTHG